MRPDILFPLFADVTTLDGVGPKVAEALEKVMGSRVRDLILTVPNGLIDRAVQPSIAACPEGQHSTVKVKILRHSPANKPNRPYKITAEDFSGEIDIIYFHARGRYLENILPEGTERLISGKVEFFGGRPQMTHPDYIVPIGKADEIPAVETLYPLTAGLSQKVAGKAVRGAVERVPNLPEWLDPALMAREGWPGWAEAIGRLHHPDSKMDLSPDSVIRKRLAYDELFAKQLALAFVRAQNRARRGQPFIAKGEYVADVLRAAPFAPTGAQSRAFEEIKADLESEGRMARLLQGDVGAGKTFVAALAAAHICEAGAQVALMAPTEILARQHAESLKAFLAPAGLTVEAVTGRDKGKARAALGTGLAEGYIDVVCGTHALFQDAVEFKNLGLVIIDEQHRFGVNDRLRLTAKGAAPDVLVMTATPIPRTLALTAYGDLDISKLDEKPAGRQAIDTRIVPMEKLDSLIEGVGRAITEGARAYWVCPLVEESEALDLSNAEDRHRQLSAIYGGRVGLLHGRMKAEEKTAISEAFKRGDYDVLVATTVIEVGVDAPDATIIVIEHAERFGLAQLHQLRGRVGRSDRKSSCFLLYQGPLSETGKKRLTTIRESEDGFVIAEADWDLRGSGDLLGLRQSGLPKFRLADLDAHRSLLDMAMQDARLLAEKDPRLETPRGKAILNLLYLFEQDKAVRLIGSG